MHATTTALYSGFAAFALAAAVPHTPIDGNHPVLQTRQTTPSAQCAALHFIVARGSYEAPGDGSIGIVVDIVGQTISNTNSYGINYPATMQDPDIYIASETNGSHAMKLAAREYHASCPDTPIVLMGYSQGAQVVADTVCGTSSPGWNVTNPIINLVAAQVIAVVQMGDPTFVYGESWNVGTATQNGCVVRNNPQGCDPFASKIQSYCDAGDPYCASGNNITVHHSYMGEYSNAAAAWVVEKYNAFKASQ